MISGNSAYGIFVNNSASQQIGGNYIGVDSSGILDRGNAYNGIYVYMSSNVTIGGSTAGAGNVISGNDSHQLQLWIGNGALFRGTRSEPMRRDGGFGGSNHGMLVQSTDGVTIGGAGAAGNHLGEYRRYFAGRG